MGMFDRLFGRKQEKEKKQDYVKEDWNFYANRANTYLTEGKFTEAIADYTKAIESLPKPKPRSLDRMVSEPPTHEERLLVVMSPELRYLRGVAYYNRGVNSRNKDDYKNAIEDLEFMTIRGGPWYEYSRWAKATLMCGDASFEICDYNKAADYYNELLSWWIPEIAVVIDITSSEIERKRDIAERKRIVALSIPNIGKLKGRKDIDGLIKALSHEVEQVRWRAAEALGEIKDERAVGPLIEAFKDESYNVRIRCESAAALGKIGDRRALEPLIKLLREDSNGFVRGSAALSLGRIKDGQAVEPLIASLLEDKDSYVRSNAAKALGSIGDEKSVKSLMKALEDKDPYVRSDAALALGKVGNEDVLKLLKNISEDEAEDSRVRRASREAVETIQKRGVGKSSPCEMKDD